MPLVNTEVYLYYRDKIVEKLYDLEESPKIGETLLCHISGEERQLEVANIMREPGQNGNKTIVHCRLA